MNSDVDPITKDGDYSSDKIWEKHLRNTDLSLHYIANRYVDISKRKVVVKKKVR